MRIINLTPIEVLLATPERERTAIEHAIVFAYLNGSEDAEKAAEEYVREQVQPFALRVAEA